MVSVPATYGAILVGGFVAAALSGIVTVQSFIYFKLYPTDLAWRKVIVSDILLIIWVLDSIHTALVCASIWIYLINNFGDTSKINDIPEYMTIALTAILTFIVHCFFAHRIHKLSRCNWRITAPIVSLVLIHLKTFSEFRQEFRWVFTLGLALSSLVDVLIAIFLCYSLRATRKASSSMDYVINSVILYTLENNSLTSCSLFLSAPATVISMICWLVMPTNLIFMGLHFVISKLYANSLLATLNARKQLRQERAQRGLSGELPLAFPGLVNRFRSDRDTSRMDPIGTKLEINVEKTVEYEVDADIMTPSPSPSSTSPKAACHSSEAILQMA
ncbi:hypothetical protein DFJ58DRAFT_806501 [Suillus subalutaceus]|uniref:uncharacterized protein n=1 Tax=Suillus subalutaceus TaxID=48586 RepID=UPI001B85E484|nr:uncharacterized protein DFJ58DRAFT_806501 [Suillus subalutaceus]KAG1842235.1 hypothetical protein DFJ58DRAFT_806501 [Suillus subalutaceus]